MYNEGQKIKKKLLQMKFIKLNIIRVQGNVITYHKNVLSLGLHEFSIQAIYGIQIPFMQLLVYRYHT